MEQNANRKIRTFIESNMISLGDEITFEDTDNIFQMGIVNSLFAMKLLSYIVKEFEVELDHDDLEIENFSTVNNILEFIEENRA